MKIAIKNKGAEELLQKLAKFVGHNHIKKYKDYYVLVLCDKILKEKLITLGIPEKDKTHTLKDIYIPNSDCLYSFLCGALDGDGHIGFSKSPFGYKTSLSYSLCNYNIEFLENLSKKIKDLLNFDSTIQYTSKSIIPVLSIGVRNGSKEFFENMYHVSPFYLDCKYQIYQEVINKT